VFVDPDSGSGRRKWPTKKRSLSFEELDILLENIATFVSKSAKNFFYCINQKPVGLTLEYEFGSATLAI
jgi:hypothetical protein